MSSRPAAWNPSVWTDGSTWATCWDVVFLSVCVAGVLCTFVYIHVFVFSSVSLVQLTAHVEELRTSVCPPEYGDYICVDEPDAAHEANYVC